MSMQNPITSTFMTYLYTFSGLLVIAQEFLKFKIPETTH